MERAKTASEVQSDIFQMLKASAVASFISGKVYLGEAGGASYRPRDSKLEDAVVMFTAGLAGQIQTGVVTINIYVQDIDPYANGVFVKSPRTAEIESACADWFHSLTAGKSLYKFSLQDTIHTTADADLRQHFVVVRLAYELFDY